MNRKNVLWQSFVLTVLIFCLGIVLNYGLDFLRINAIVDVMQEHELDRSAYQAEDLFAEVFEGNRCSAMSSRIAELKQEIRQVGEDLGSYSRFSFFKKKDFDYLKRRYFLLQLRFFSLIQKVNSECGDPYIPILFFYEIDDEASERQGFILQELSENFNEQLVVLSLDIDYEDEPLVGLLADYYDVDKAPTMIIDGEKFEGLTYESMLNSTVLGILTAPDPYAGDVDFTFTLNATGINESMLLQQVRAVVGNESADPFARADAMLMLGRITKNRTLICGSLAVYDEVHSSDPEVMALVYETSAAVGCGRNRKAFLAAAASEWKKAGNEFRASLDKSLSTGFVPELVFDANATTSNATVITGYNTPILPKPFSNVSKITMGGTEIIVGSEDLLLTQVDRVHRDWLGGQFANPFDAPLKVVFSEKNYYNASELREDIGWHEGARTKELVDHGISYAVGAGTLVARNGDRWFAVDDKGVFRFEVPVDKLYYPTTRFLHENLAVIMDTHGVNMLVEQAIRKHADFVMGCCDHPGKIYAAKYLSDHGIPVVCLTDKYVYLLLGHNATVLGSPPFSFGSNYVKIGGRPISITADDKVLAMNASDKTYALWYYQTPASYFSLIGGLDVDYFTIDDYNEMGGFIDYARSINATVIAVRVYNKNDYAAVKGWLEEDEAHQAVLFHSAAYPYGQVLFGEFPFQTTFDDPNPVAE
ncbi:hypothetical protein KY329_01585 [Candidatus Woesearchaeota archaeon]|nr:hypothetical protein [Candidatus Woesearchaeota archaeon]